MSQGQEYILISGSSQDTSKVDIFIQNQMKPYFIIKQRTHVKMIESFPITEIGENIADFESNPYAEGSIQYRTSSDQTTILFQTTTQG